MVQRHFEPLFPGKVQRVHMGYDMRRVSALVREYHRTRERLLDLADEATAQARARQRGRAAAGKHKKRVRASPCAQRHTAGDTRGFWDEDYM
jgi:hypothetical protein